MYSLVALLKSLASIFVNDICCKIAISALHSFNDSDGDGDADDVDIDDNDNDDDYDDDDDDDDYMKNEYMPQGIEVTSQVVIGSPRLLWRCTKAKDKSRPTDMMIGPEQMICKTGSRANDIFQHAVIDFQDLPKVLMEF